MTRDSQERQEIQALQDSKDKSAHRVAQDSKVEQEQRELQGYKELLDHLAVLDCLEIPANKDWLELQALLVQEAALEFQGLKA